MREAVYPSLTPDELASAGQALFGAGWRGELARAFGVSETDIARVEAGRTEAPPTWRAELVALAQDMALRALETASTLLWRVTETEDEAPGYAPPTPIYA